MALPEVVTMSSTLLEHDRRAAGLTVAAWRIGVIPAVDREFESGTRLPTSDTWGRICKLYGWPRTADPDLEVRALRTVVRLQRGE